MSTKTKPKAKPVATTKKPVYKQWWFWVVIVVVLLIIGAIGSNGKTPQTQQPNSNNQSQEQPEETTETEETETSTDTYRVGDTITLKNQTVSIVSIQRDYSTGNPYVTPKDGKEYIKVNISVANTSNAKRYFSAGDWKIQDSDGVIDTYSFTATAMLDDAFDSSIELASGGKTSGSLIFEVPKGDNGLELQYKASLLKTVIVKL
ncbi:DUF4352 domain-containing protein [Candidatus Saccharibacteria bacterium]|nr:DUF4352 domain-containing protein [Candidatus Saccharibacteria bacterium]MBR3263759.1 DUF4352 domain-containing protein [Candidatus Saccharibacteria bacterium]